MATEKKSFKFVDIPQTMMDDGPKIPAYTISSGELKYLNSTIAKRGSVFFGLMTSDGAIWFRYQRTVLMR